MSPLSRIIFCVFIITISNRVIGQSYNYVTYTTRDGLAGNMVYDMCQDNLGFLWFGTDNGLSRFDGSNFKNYTVKDGLADNEVLLFHNDYYGRLWLGTFSHELTYIKNGKIFNRYNDTMLAGISPLGKVITFRNGPDSTLWIYCQNQLFCLPKNGKLHEVIFHPSIIQRLKTGIIHPPGIWRGNYPTISFNDSLFLIKDDSLIYISEFKYQTGISSVVVDRGTDPPLRYTFPNHVVRISMLKGYPHLVATVKGAYEFNIKPPSTKPIDYFLPQKGVTSAIMDLEGNYWFSTLGDGVFKLVSKSALTYSISNEVNALNEVFSIGTRNDSILTGHGGSRLAIWRGGKLENILSFEEYLPQFENSISTNRLKAILPLKSGAWLLGFDSFLFLKIGNSKKLLPMKAIKTMELLSDSTVLVASGQDVIEVDLNAFSISKIIFNQRATCATTFNGKVFIGTLGGLLVNDGRQTKTFNKSDSILSRRIAALGKYKQSLWVATSDAGVVEITSSGIRRLLNESNGLPSNICRTLTIKDDYLWIGTNKGLARINLANNKENIVVFNQFNLLPNDAVTSVLLNEQEVLVGSPSGLTIFEPGRINSNSICGLVIDKIQSSRKVWNVGDTVLLDRLDNFLQIDYSGISAKAAGQIDYFFMLEGIDNDWKQTKANVITYGNLAPGSYTFKIFARNRFGVESEINTFLVNVVAPFWRTRLFLAFSIMLILGLIFLIAYSRMRLRHRKIEENNRIQKQLAELEQKALQAQMNPHFIFNSLNSIQQYIVTNNQADANKYLSIFAALIRETLEHSSHSNISIKKEIDYLSKYLELEQLRFGMRFSFSISDEGIQNRDEIMVPAMLIQPFVENAVRHGMRYRLDGLGEIKIIFKLIGQTLHCFVEDNGPGRAKTSSIRTFQHIEYQSRGLDLTQKRIELLNKIYRNNISFNIEDIVDDNGNVKGTRVHIKITQSHE